MSKHTQKSGGMVKPHPPAKPNQKAGTSYENNLSPQAVVVKRKAK